MRKLLLVAVLGQILVHFAIAQTSDSKADSAFSFDVYGDSRSMMYLPYKQDQEAEARKLMVDMFEVVLPARVADAVVQKDVKLTYDPAGKELVQMTMPFITTSEVTTLKFDKGWVTEAHRFTSDGVASTCRMHPTNQELRTSWTRFRWLALRRARPEKKHF